MKFPLQKHRARRWFALALLAQSSAIFAATLSLTATEDTSIFSGHPNGNIGGSTLVAGTNQQNAWIGRAMFRFDLSVIPAGAIIDSAEVTLSVVTIPDPMQHGGPQNSDFGLYRLLVSWGEGVGVNVIGLSPPAAGDATWISRHHGSDLWKSPGGAADDGLDEMEDYVGSASSSAFVTGLGDFAFGSTPSTVADAQLWLDNPALNFGFMLISSSEGIAGTGRRFASTEISSPGTPPTLQLSYTVVPEPSVMGLAFVGLLGLGSRRRVRG